MPDRPHPVAPPAQLVVANLDYETPDLPRRVRRAISAAGTLLRVFAADGARLWTPEPVDPDRVPGRRVELLSGDRPREPGALWWAGGDDVPPDVLSRVNHRRFAFDLGPSLPGSRWISDAAGFAPTHDAWVLKAPLGAAGRGQIRRRGREIDDATRTRIERLLAGHGELLYEPWLERTADYGCVGTVGEATELCGVHRLLIDRTGVFRGIELDPALALPAVTDTARRVADALRTAGYRGPFGIDAFSYRDDAGEQLHPLCEINARYSFGHIARALGDPPLTLQLAFSPERIPDGANILLHPGKDDPTAAWVE